MEPRTRRAAGGRAGGPSPASSPWSGDATVAAIAIALVATCWLGGLAAIRAGHTAGVGGWIARRSADLPQLAAVIAVAALARPWSAVATPDRRRWLRRVVLPAWPAWWVLVAWGLIAQRLRPGAGSLATTLLAFQPFGAPIHGLYGGTLLATVVIVAAILPRWHRRLGEVRVAAALTLVGVVLRIVLEAASDSPNGLVRTPLGHVHLVGLGLLLAHVRLPAGRSPGRLARIVAWSAPGILLAGEPSFELIARRYRERVGVLDASAFLTGRAFPPFLWALLTGAAVGVLVTAVYLSVPFVRRPRWSAVAASKLAFASVVALGWLIRLETLLRVAPERTDGGDPLFYHTTANLLAKGRGFDEPLKWLAFGTHRPSALHGPLYPLLLSISSRFGGTSYVDHKLASIVIGTELVAGVGLLARRLAGPTAGLIGALLAAVYPNMWIIDGLLYPENLLAVCTVLALIAAYRWRARPRVSTALALGALVALGALSRGEGLLLGPVMVAPLILLTRTLPWRRRLGHLALAGVACLAVLAPWTIRNARTFADFVPLSTNGNELFVYANCETSYYGPFVGYWDYQCQQRLRQSGQGPDEDVLDESQSTKAWRQIGIDYMKDHLGALPRVVATRVLRQWELYAPKQNIAFVTIEGRNRTASTLGLLMYYAQLPFAVVGGLALRRRRTTLIPLLAPFVVVTLTAAYTYGNIRFRASAEPALCVLAAIGLLVTGRRALAWLRRPPPRNETADDPRAFVLGGSGGLRVRRNGVRQVGAIRTWCALAVVAAVTALPVPGLFRSTGGNMEEGFMIVFPERMWHGAMPNRDFLHLYGPGALYVLMGWFKVFGFTLGAERSFGLLQHIAVIAALFVLARPWGRVAATCVAAFSTVLVLTPVGLTAMAWNGGLALCLWSVIMAIRARHLPGGAQGSMLAALGSDTVAPAPPHRRRRPAARRSPRTWCLVAAGVLAGLALTYRPDQIVALGVFYGWYLWSDRRQAAADGTARRAWRPVAFGAAVGLVPMWIHLAIVGPMTAFRGMVLDPVFKLRPGRELPHPPSWSHIDGALQAVAELIPPWWKLPALSASHSLFVWFWVTLATPFVLLWVARRVRRSGGAADRRGTVLWGGALFSLGLLPQAWQRPDSAHLAWVTCVSFPLLAVAIAEIVRQRRPHRFASRQRAVLGAAAVVALTLFVAPLFTFRYYLLHTRVGIGSVQAPYRVERGDRSFYLGAIEAATASRGVIAELDRLSKPGETLVVGPQDLRRTFYSDAFFYYLFPDLKPGTFFIEMDPGMANAPGSRLAGELRTTDWVILTEFWNGWVEPNTSTAYGSDEPNQVIRDHFCQVGDYGQAQLYHRCR